MYYYVLIMLSVILFGVCFSLNDTYRAYRGGGMKSSLEFSLVASLAGLVVLIAVNGFSLQFTWFSLLMAVLVAVDGLSFSFCSFRALGSINLSMYSLFSMLGGMLLPFLQGLLLFHEEFTVAKALCLCFIGAGLLLTVKREKSERSGGIYYALVFFLNGMSGVLAKFFQAAPIAWKTMPSGELVTAAGYTVLSALAQVVITGFLLLVFFRGKPYASVQTKNGVLIGLAIALFSGPVNRVGNWILQLALDFVDTSVQYPMVTGGTMIVMTVICFFTKSKPSKRELLSVVLAFGGLLVLFLFPILASKWNLTIFKI